METIYLIHLMRYDNGTKEENYIETTTVKLIAQIKIF